MIFSLLLPHDTPPLPHPSPFASTPLRPKRPFLVTRGPSPGSFIHDDVKTDLERRNNGSPSRRLEVPLCRALSDRAAKCRKVGLKLGREIFRAAYVGQLRPKIGCRQTKLSTAGYQTLNYPSTSFHPSISMLLPTVRVQPLAAPNPFFFGTGSDRCQQKPARAQNGNNTNLPEKD